MASTPTQNPPRLSVALSPQDVEASERDLVELLQMALAPSFVLVRRLGAGGMGIVYLARDPALKRLVAVKVMSPDRANDPDARARFQREAESVAAISHPNVVAVHSVGALSNGIPYLVMQYVDGPSMAERLATEGPLDLGSAKQIIGQVASALDAAHRKGIIHRDIKAANILWDETTGRALVSDFGIAGVLEPDYDSGVMRLTQTGMVMGTPQYMSPEQLLHEPVTDKTDIYSLGLLGYELLTGEGPYQGTSPNAILAAHLRDAPRSLSSLRPDADPVLESLLASCLEKDAHGRPSAEDVARRLQHGASILLEWPPPGLEDLHGAIDRPLGRLLWGAFAIAIPLTIVATAGIDSPLRPGWPQIMILPLVAGMGGVAVLFAAVEGARLLRDAMRAARAGYGWGIIVEVLADAGKDTGALISGEREYAALSTDQRNTIRHWRVLRVALQASAGAWTLGGFLIGLPIAARLSGSAGFLAAWTLGIPLALLIGARELAARESKMLHPIRSRLRRHRAPLDRLSHLAATWRDSFDRLVTDAARGQGTVGRVTRRVVGIAAVAAAGVVGIVGAYGLMTVSLAGESAATQSMPRFSSVQEKAMKIRRLRAIRPAIDPTVTPLQAGYAYQSISNAGGKEPQRYEAPTRYPIPAIEAVDQKRGSPFEGGWGGGNAIRQASKGLSADQRRFLGGIAAAPGAAEYSVLARAASIDWVSAMLVNPLPKDAVWYAVPIPRFSRLKSVGYAHAARAALALADGKPQEAERLLRENIGAGFAMMEGPTLIDNLIGFGIVSAGRSELVALYDVTGRASEARAISAETDPVRDETAVELQPWTMAVEARDAYVQGIIRDSSLLRGLRWEMALGYLAYQPCTDLRQILLGPSDKHLQDLASARKALVRTPGDEQLMQLAERSLDAVVPREGLWASVGDGSSVAARSLSAFARTVDALTGSRRMQACTTLIPLP